MSAYNNPDWAECYDLWVRILFGDGPVEDIPVFCSILQSIVNSSSNPSSSITIVDIGTGSGRVPVHLLDTIQKNGDKSFEVWGTEPSSAMLDRAKRA
jgi:ubiquinone/menaquinone biosynthesis C-methylase UbiE